MSAGNAERPPIELLDWPVGVCAILFDRFKILLGSRKIPTRFHAPPKDLRVLLRSDYLRDLRRFYPYLGQIQPQRLGERPLSEAVTVIEYRYRTPLPLGHENNHTGWLYEVRPRGRPPVICLVALHGWGRRNLSGELTFASRLAAAGVATVWPELPFHMRRTPPGTWSGECMISSDVLRTAYAFKQTVCEVRGLLPWLRERFGRAGIFGISLGGILAHLAMIVERFDCGISVLAGGESANITWHGLLTRYVRRDIERAGIDLPTLRRLWAAASPAKAAPQNRTWPILMIAGKFDQIVPTRTTMRLHRALGHRPVLRWLPCAHYSVAFFTNTLVREILNFLSHDCRLALLGEPDESRSAGATAAVATRSADLAYR